MDFEHVSVLIAEDDGGLWVKVSPTAPAYWIGPRARAAIAQHEASHGPIWKRGPSDA